MGILRLYGSGSAALYGSETTGLRKVGREMVGECKSHGMGVNLAVTHFFGNMESEEANCYIQKEHQWSNRHHLTHKTFNPKFFLSTSNAETMDG